MAVVTTRRSMSTRSKLWLAMMLYLESKRFIAGMAVDQLRELVCLCVTVKLSTWTMEVSFKEGMTARFSAGAEAF